MNPLANFTPDLTIVGKAPQLPGSDPREAAYWMASELLDTEAVRLIVHAVGGHVHFLAAPADGFTKAGGLGSALESVLGAEGSVVQQAPTPSGGMIAVLVHDGRYEKSVGPAELVQRFIAAKREELPQLQVRPLSDEGMAPWEPFNLGQLRREARAAMAIVRAGLAVALAAGIGYLAAAGIQATARTDEGAFDLANRNALTAEMEQLRGWGSNPAADELARLQELSSAIMASGGWIEEYRYERATGASWSARLPRWATAEQIERLGHDVRATKDPTHDQILVQWGKQ